MAKCDAGYFCKVCGEYVEGVTTSELYLRFVLGEVPYDRLRALPDVHITCNPNLAQYIVDERFIQPELDEPKLHKSNFDPEWVKAEEERVTRGWAHLQMIAGSGLPLEMYPLDRSGDDADESAEPEPAADEASAFETGGPGSFQV